MSLNVELLTSSFEEIKVYADDFTDHFYQTLFTDYPEVKPLFDNTHMNEQGKKLFASLVLVVQNLTAPNTLTDALRGLGTRHVKYGVVPQHYPMVGITLLKSMAFVLQDRWTDETAQAWTEAYAAITEIMLDGCDYSQDILHPA